jgi:hypothetical protein
MLPDDKIESVFWRDRMAILEAALGLPNSQRRHKWHYERSLNRHYTGKFIAGLTGEKEGRKWLKEQGFQVFEFGMAEGYFERLKEASESLAKRRKQIYIEQDKAVIKLWDDRLRKLFDNKFEQAKSFYFEFIPKRREIWRLRRGSRRRGGISPDFIVKKDGALSMIEIKVNTSKPTIYQKMCFELAKKHGINSMVLNVNVEARMAKELKLSKCQACANSDI